MSIQDQNTFNVLVQLRSILEDNIILVVAIVGANLIKRFVFDIKRIARRNYYRNIYLKSDAWRRKRHVVLERDKWQCVYYGKRAAQVHHKRYAKRKIGKEPIKWLVSVRHSCHSNLHR